ncbi:MAG: hypothetical protein KGL39_34340 [Patescibacteria group bacterium]|nr:hypothetical protein [Patescibacteria group bacterium]
MINPQDCRVEYVLDNFASAWRNRHKSQLGKPNERLYDRLLANLKIAQTCMRCGHMRGVHVYDGCVECYLAYDPIRGYCEHFTDECSDSNGVGWKAYTE